ncbi:MAG: endonuclease MutS2, partial [Lachnospiraceae bacterium]|nr:endonuclease MutS2 [Lachnospiraceae bacterium]
MNEKVLSTLEYTNIISMLVEHADSAPGKELCKNLLPMTSLSDIEEAQTQTQDALSRLFSKGSISFGSNKDLGFAMKSLEIGSILMASELLSFARFLNNVNRVKTYGAKEKDDDEGDSLSDYFELLEPMTLVSKEIDRCILDEEGNIADDASPTLKSIRKSLQQTNEKIHSELNKMVNGSLKSYLQDSVVTMRNDRYCVPVKSEYKGQVSGMVHDQSSSGSTFFIEPQAIVDLNNKIRELHLDEQKEIAVILANLSAELS